MKHIVEQSSRQYCCRFENFVIDCGSEGKVPEVKNVEDFSDFHCSQDLLEIRKPFRIAERQFWKSSFAQPPRLAAKAPMVSIWVHP